MRKPEKRWLEGLYLDQPKNGMTRTVLSLVSDTRNATICPESLACDLGLCCPVCRWHFSCSPRVACSADRDNLLDDPSFESPKEKDQFGLVFSKWGGWKYEGDCDFAVGTVARTGRHSCLLIGGAGAKIRVRQPHSFGSRSVPRDGLSARARHRHGHMEHEHGIHV